MILLVFFLLFFMGSENDVKCVSLALWSRSMICFLAAHWGVLSLVQILGRRYQVRESACISVLFPSFQMHQTAIIVSEMVFSEVSKLNYLFARNCR